MNKLIVILLNIVFAIVSSNQAHADINSSGVSGGITFQQNGQRSITGQVGHTPARTSDTTRANYWFNKAEGFSDARNYDSAIVYYNKASAIYKNTKCWVKFVQCYNSIGSNSRRTRDTETAQEYLEQALETGLKELGKDNLEVAKSYYNLGAVYSQQSDYDLAIDYFEESLSIRIQLLGGYHPDVASSYNAIGSVYYAKGNYDKTLECCFQSLSIQRQTLDDDHPKIVSSYNNIGLVYLEKGDYAKATEYFNKSLDIVLRTNGQDDPKNAGIYRNIGNVYYAKGDYDKALEFYNKSLANKLKTIGEYHRDVADEYNNIGLIHIKKRDFDKAFEYLNKAINIKLETEGENNPGIATIYSNIGLAYIEKGDHDKALEYFNESLSIRLQLFGEDHPDVSTSYHNIGNAYHYKGEYDKALEYHDKSLAIRLELLGENHINVATSYNSTGLNYLEKGEYDEALKYLNKSLTVVLQLFGANHLRVAQDYNYIGLVYIEKGDYDEALEYFNKSLKILLQLFDGINKDVAMTYNHVGIAYSKKDDFESALTNFQKSLQWNVKGFVSGNVYDNPPLEGMISEVELELALYHKAKMLAALYHKTGNLEYLQASVSTFLFTFVLIDKMCIGYKAEGSKLVLAENTALYAEEAISATLYLYEATGDPQYQYLAFSFAEKNKASILYESVSEANARHFSGIPDSLLQKEKQLRTDLAFYENQIQKNELDSLTDKEFKSRFFKLNVDYEQLIDLLEQRYPGYYKMKYDLSVAGVKEIQHGLKASNGAFIEYFLGKEFLYTLVISSDTFEVLETAIDSAFCGDLEMYLSLLQSYNIVQLKYRKQFFSHSHRLYNILIAPVEHIIQDCSKLVIIPDNILNQLPFETLVSSIGNSDGFDTAEYLLKRYAISYHFSATLYKNAQKADPNEFAHAKQWSGFAPVFNETGNDNEVPPDKLRAFEANNAKEHYRAVTGERKYFNALPFSAYEVESIDKIFKAHDQKSDMFLYEQASENEFKTRCGNYKYIHLATHSIVNANTPKLSGIIFSQHENMWDNMDKLGLSNENNENTSDGILYAGEIYNLDIDAKLVVLSSCESGIGMLAEGEGMMALTRALLYAGAQNQIASLWKVEDKSSAELMILFYDELLSGKSIPEALRGAKLKIIEQNVPPVFWGAYVLTGE